MTIDGRIQVGDILPGPDGPRVVVQVVAAHELQSSPYIKTRREERSALFADPDLERKQAQQAPQS